MKMVYLIFLAAALSVSYDYYMRYEKLLSSNEINFYISYQVDYVDECVLDGCLVKVKKGGETMVTPQKVYSIEKLTFRESDTLVRQCTFFLQEKIAKCDKDLTPISHIEPKYVRYPDLDFRASADQVIYQ